MSANGQERLKGIQSRLEKMGAKDVKFCFANTGDKPLSVVANDVANALQARLDDKHTIAKPFGDRPAS